MFNHLRTLLANLAPFDGWGAYLAEELIDARFRPLTLPSDLGVARQALFGVAPDRNMINYRCRQFVTLLHATEYADYVTTLDPRITYSTGEDVEGVSDDWFRPAVFGLSGGPSGEPSDDSAVDAPDYFGADYFPVDYFDPAYFGTSIPVVHSNTAGDADDLVVFGAPSAPDSSGVVARAYGVRVESSTTARVFNLIQNLVFEFTVSDGLSTPIPLTGSGYYIRLATSVPGAEWLVQVRNRPQWDLGGIAAGLATAGEPAALALFGIDDVEPYATFRNLWLRQQELPGRLAGALLALAYRMEEVRLASG